MALVLCLGLVACGKDEQKEPAASSQEPSESVESQAEASSAAEAGETRTITDMTGKTVEIPAHVEKVATAGIFPLPAVVANYMGTGQGIVGMDPMSMRAAESGLLGKMYPDLLKASTAYIQGDSLNAEELLKLKPDVIFYNAPNEKMKTQLEGTGLPVIGIMPKVNDFNAMATIQDWMKVLDQVYPDSKFDTAAFNKFCEESLARVEKQVKALPEDQQVKALHIYSYDDGKLMVSGPKFFGNWWITQAGGKNVAGDLDKPGQVPVTMEQVLEWNPDVIFISNFTQAMPEDLYNNAISGNDWSTVQAVKDKRVYKLPLASYRTFTPGVDTPLTLLWHAQCMYPDLFKDLDMKQEFKDFYKNFFNYDLSDEEVQGILNPPREAGKLN